MDFSLEVVTIPVSDVERAKQFYAKLGWRLDIDFSAPGGFRVIQFTPPGSACSIALGNGITRAAPGSLQGLELVVSDIAAARADIASRGIAISDVYHEAKLAHRASAEVRVPGPDPEGRSYFSFADFADPDGNTWLLQEVTQRAPGR
jgi:catechol 2,3-dioxygenase-like lactoylglutathione lyase family enzyme